MDSCPSVEPNPTANSSGKLFCLIPLALSLCSIPIYVWNIVKKIVTLRSSYARISLLKFGAGDMISLLSFYLEPLFMFNVFGFVGMFSSVKVNPFKYESC